MKATKNILKAIILVLVVLITIPAKAQDSITFSSDDTLNIFLLRGLTRESGHWGAAFTENLLKEFPNAKLSFLDLPGSGIYNNEKAALTVNKIMEFMREREIENINKMRGKNLIMATSLGGMVAVEWMDKHPEDFQGLIMISSSFKGICSMDERAKKEVRKEMVAVMFEKDMKTREEMLLKINSNDTANFTANLDEWVDVQDRRPMTKANILRQTIAGMRYSAPELKPEVPILIIGSKGDRLVSETCITKVHDEFGGSLVWHDTAGHGVPIDAPEWLVSTVKIWVDGQSDTAQIAYK
ncbi:alpha/beta hydrolase [Flavobacteriales bacterium AH-315-E23]|nr:alpha/beta hydrolase [Flavobacteriales bacterium AH-315-E23]